MSFFDQEEREARQKSWGCLGISTMAHIALLAVIISFPDFRVIGDLMVAAGDSRGEGQIVQFTADTGNEEVSLGAPSVTNDLTPTPSSKNFQTGPVRTEAFASTPKNSAPFVLELVESTSQVEVAPPKQEPAKKSPAPLARLVQERVQENVTPPPSRDTAPAPTTKAPEPTYAEEDQAILAAIEASSAHEEESLKQDPQLSDFPQPFATDSLEPAALAKADKMVSPHKPTPIQESPPVVPFDQTRHDVFPESKQELIHPMGAHTNPVAANHQVVPGEELGALGSTPSAGAGTGGPSGYGLGPGVAIRDASDLVSLPGNRLPLYPQEDRLQGHQGVAVVVGQVLANGTVGRVYLEQGSGSHFMDQAAIAAFKNWRFQPGQAGYARKPFLFQLRGQAQIMPAQLRR